MCQQSEEFKGCIFFDGVSKWHRYENMTLNRINLKIEQYEQVLICAQSKVLEDIFDLLTKYILPDEGHLTICGKYGIVPDEFPYLYNLKVMDYLLLPFIIQGIKKQEAAASLEKQFGRGDLWKKKTVKIQFLNILEKYELLLMMAVCQYPQIIIIGKGIQLLTDEDQKHFWKIVSEYRHIYKYTLVCLSGGGNIPYMFERKYRICNGVLEGGKYIE